jgi:hypothetical protein
MINSVTVAQVLKDHHPKSPKEFKEKCGMKLMKLGTGLYRSTYKVVGVSVVIKFPNYMCGVDKSEYHTYRDEVYHMISEHRAISKILRCKRKYRMLKQFVPDVYYFNRKTGVIATEQCVKLRNSDVSMAKDMLVHLVNDIVELTWAARGCTDLHSSNIGVSLSGDLKIIDFGYFYEEA